MSFVWIFEQAVTFASYRINRLVLFNPGAKRSLCGTHWVLIKTKTFFLLLLAIHLCLYYPHHLFCVLYLYLPLLRYYYIIIKIITTTSPSSLRVTPKACCRSVMNHQSTFMILHICSTRKLHLSATTCSLQHANTRITLMLCIHPQVAFNAETDEQISNEYAYFSRSEPSIK